VKVLCSRGALAGSLTLLVHFQTIAQQLLLTVESNARVWHAPAGLLGQAEYRQTRHRVDQYSCTACMTLLCSLSG
jgi:hypothetical protein